MSQAAVPGQPPPVPKVVLCPYCGSVSKDPARCDSCKGYFDPLSRQATQNSMGPWSIRDEASPFRPGCSFEVMRGLALRGKIGPNTILRGPTTNQFWAPARRVPGVANLLGICHNCGGPAGADDVACLNCGATFRFHEDRQELGLTEVRLLPGRASPEAIAEGTDSARGVPSRPQFPGVSAAAAPNPPRAAPVQVKPESKAEAPGGVPKWVYLIAVLVVVGAIVAAAWIMGKLPGFPSPIAPPDATNTAGEGAKLGSSASVDTSATPADGVGERLSEPAGEVIRGSDAEPKSPITASPEVVPSGAREGRLEEAKRLIRVGRPEGLLDAAKIAAEAGPGGDAEALKRAAEGLTAQRSLVRLP